jgi:putative ABC transport system permease protein
MAAASMLNGLSFALYVSLKEVWRNRGRFFLLSLVIALITLLVLFIAALGEGLADGNREYLANLDSQLIVFREKSDYGIASSRLEASTLRAVRRIVGNQNAGPIYVSTTEIVSTQPPIKVSLMSAEPGHPGMPDVVTGRGFRGGNSKEAVIDRDLALRSGLHMGDDFEIRSTQGLEDRFSKLTVVGLTEGQSYLFQPSLFVTPTTWERSRPQSEADARDGTPYPSIIAVNVADTELLEQVTVQLLTEVPRIEIADIATTINNIPGYSEQESTIRTQGVFTLLIGVLVIGGFFQIQVLQKVPQLGVLKAIGSSNSALAAAALIQIVVVTAAGVGLGAFLTFLLSLAFPPTIPLSFDGTSAALSVLALMLIGPIGGLVSVVYAVRIEPLRALRLQ